MDNISIEISELLRQLAQGDQHALESLKTVLNDELRQLAEAHLRRERINNTLRPTALLRESYLKLVKQQDISWENRIHFFNVASQVIRPLLIDYVRARNANKQSGNGCKLSLYESLDWKLERGVDLFALDSALAKLDRSNPSYGRIVELRFFGGLSIEEIATVLNISVYSVSRGWRLAKSWLVKEIGNA